MKVKIAYLKEYQEYMTALSLWSFETWAQYHPKATRKNQIEKFRQHCNIDVLPLTVVALNENDDLLGMCSLRETEGIRPELTPWVGSHYVVPSQRKQKVGEKLMAAVKRIAKSMNFEVVYSLTFDASLNSYYVNQGWEVIGDDEVNNHPVSVMEFKLV